jgi:trans-aconitate methyltransferase
MADPTDNPLKAVSTFRPGYEAEEVYDRWADSYDHDLVESFGYNSPALVAAALAAMLPDKGLPIVDHACGSGLSGEALRTAGFEVIDGVDVSSGMLRHARAKGVYRNVIRADLTDPSVTLEHAPYAAMTVVGAVAPGHLEPEDLPAVMRTVQVGSPVVVYLNAAYDESHDYVSRMEELETAGYWTVERRERTNYMDALDRPGWLIAAHRAR